MLTEMVVDLLPSPVEMSPERAERLICPRSMRFDELLNDTQQLKDGESPNVSALVQTGGHITN